MLKVGVGKNGGKRQRPPLVAVLEADRIVGKNGNRVEPSFRVLTQNQRRINGKSAKTVAMPICCRARKVRQKRRQNGGQKRPGFFKPRSCVF
jgi:hypothetical protein